MVQIGLIALALLFFWEGAKGFRSSGIKVGLFKADKRADQGYEREGHRVLCDCRRTDLSLLRPRVPPVPCGGRIAA
jgi:hypothetical protein